MYIRAFPGGSDCKESACNVGDPGSIRKIPWRGIYACVRDFQIPFHYRLLYDIVCSSLWGWGEGGKLGFGIFTYTLGG